MSRPAPDAQANVEGQERGAVLPVVAEPPSLWAWIWRLGQAALVAIPNEPYVVFQQRLRQRFAGTPLLVLGVTNGSAGYLTPQELYGRGIYQERQSPFASGCLEATIAAAEHGLEQVIGVTVHEAA